MSRVRSFGPFVKIPCEAIKPAGYDCTKCRKPVEKFAQAMPVMAPRTVFYSCRCGTVVVWEDESQPENSEIWRWNIELLRQNKSEIVIFNGNKPVTPAFGGQN